MKEVVKYHALMLIEELMQERAEMTYDHGGYLPELTGLLQGKRQSGFRSLCDSV